MIPFMVRNQIESALAAPAGRDAFAQRMTTLADDQGIVLFHDDLEGLIVLAERYIRGTMRLLENCEIAAREGRIEAMFEPLIKACCEFFLTPPEVMSDQGGLLGMTADSYLARTLIAIASGRMMTVRGFPLLATDPHNEEPVICIMIGVDLANTLYDLAERLYDSPKIRFYGNSAYMLQGQLRASANLKDWGGSWRDDALQFASKVGLKLDGGDARPDAPGQTAATMR